jgi:hypothetical protein
LSGGSPYAKNLKHQSPSQKEQFRHDFDESKTSVEKILIHIERH